MIRKLLAYINSREFQEMMFPNRAHTPGEDLADSIGLIVICALLMFVVFI